MVRHKDPVAQLQKLAKQQSEVLQRLGGGAVGGGEGSAARGRGAAAAAAAVAGGTSRSPKESPKEIPSRPLPFGSEGVRSPTYLALQKQLQRQRQQEEEEGEEQRGKGKLPTTGKVLSPTPMKPAAGTMSVRNISDLGPEAARASPDVKAMTPISAPSYGGPGVQFEKGEEVMRDRGHVLPSEKLQDEMELFDD